MIFGGHYTGPHLYPDWKGIFNTKGQSPVEGGQAPGEDCNGKFKIEGNFKSAGKTRSKTMKQKDAICTKLYENKENSTLVKEMLVHELCSQNSLECSNVVKDKSDYTNSGGDINSFWINVCVEDGFYIEGVGLLGSQTSEAGLLGSQTSDL